jgi:uncharacterized BrkB/YihY/UPF0761 family membrane protein
MWMRIAKTTLGFPLKYVSGFIFAMICFVAAMAVCGVFVRAMPRCASLGIVVGAGIFVGIPIGAMLGIYLIDRFILGAAVLKRQMIAGFLAGVATSVSLVILHFYGVEIFSRLPYDGPSGGLGGFSLFYIIGVLTVLFGYTIMGLTKRKTTKEVNSPKEQESS